MGGANNICSDKTGTLTKNVMTLTTWWNTEYQEFKYQDQKMDLTDYAPKEFHQLFIHQCALNTGAQLRPDEKVFINFLQRRIYLMLIVIQGSRTDIALLKALD